MAWPAFASGAKAPGVSLTELGAWPALPASALLDRTLVAGLAGVRLADASKTTKVTGGIAVGDLLSAPALSVIDLMAKSNGKSPEKAAAPQVSVASTPAVTKEPLTVQVTIPSDPTQKLMAKPVVVLADAPAAKSPGNDPALTIGSKGPGILTVSPKNLSFAKAGMKVAVKIAGKGLEGLTLFVRDQNIVELKKQTNELIARGAGATELYAVSGGKMYIVPMTVTFGAGSMDLKVPEALVSLDGVFQGSLQSALYPGLEQASQTVARGRDEATGAPAPSLNDSVAETARAVQAQDRELDRYYSSDEKLSYKAVTIQILDERSAPAAGKIFPVAGAQVHLVGTEFTARTDSTGHLTIRDMPARSRFFLVIDEPNGQIRPGLAELRTGDDTETGVIRLKVMRGFTFDALASIAQTTQDASLGSYCATVTDRDQTRASMTGVSVQADVAAEGPFYFNSYGYLDRALNATGPDGRFCYFNVSPGPVALTLYDQQALVATLPVSTYAGRHVEDGLVLGGEVKLTTRLATMATAHEQLGSDVRVANSYKTIDSIDFIPLGTDEPMEQLGPGLMATSDTLLPHAGRIWAYARAAEFEPTVYAFSSANGDRIAPLIPRGFVEDMSLYAQVTHNSDLGVVLVEYGTPVSVAGGTLSMKLVDGEGRDAGDGWYFADSPATKAIFFNVPAGSYSILVETNDGYWLSAETVIVYNETVSYVRMGNAIRFRR